MKKSIAMGVCVTVLAGCLVGCGGPEVDLVEEPVINYGESEYYTEEDMDAGIAIIKEQMDSWGIEYNLQDISYAGDDLSGLGTLYVKSLTEDYETVECMVFLVDWVCLSDSQYYDKNKLYEDWEWYIMHGDDGEWLFFTNGYLSDYILIEEETTTTASGNILQDLLDEMHATDEAEEEVSDEVEADADTSEEVTEAEAAAADEDAEQAETGGLEETEAE